jgi:hypothetical protein
MVYSVEGKQDYRPAGEKVRRRFENLRKTAA